ncbi:porin family protein [Cytophagaceae bacterium DM2B3-1]|uniref:Porin family protein n=1 Tax=Xanthocytophaga flava TaxID=3048013 RepID=A0ABT7CF84_9BACT|nr:porin family protein [Xanthocytophaga flavus]MDJ1492297.1 porin family protein [Xanthocytophaga flavus]
MKKVHYVGVIALLLLFFATSTSYAQAKFGIKGGVNLSNFYSGDDVSDNNLKPGFQAGLYVKAPIIEDVLFIQPELLYTRKGAQSTYSNFIQGSGKYQFGLGYAQLPVLLGVDLGIFNIHAGPYVAYLTDAKVKDVDNDGSINGVTDLNRDNFNSLDYGLSGGIGLDFEAAQIGLRYDLGLREIGASGLAGELTKNYKNSALQLYVGFHF